MREDDIRPQALLDEFFVRLKRDAERLAARRDEFVEIGCPFCGSVEGETAFVKEGFAYRLCRDCASLFASPRPSPEALADYMALSEALEFWSTHFYRQTAAARRQKMFRPRAALAASLADRQGLGADAVCADVGAGYGLFLAELAATRRFGRLVAIEPDARLAAICREQGFPVVERWVEDVGDGEVRADVATAFEVIEHVFSPLAFLGACARLVAPGGVLLVTTLTISGFDLQELWEHSRQISPPQHLNFPSLDGVRGLVRRAGLDLVELSTPGELDVDIVRNCLAAEPGLPVSRFARRLAAADAQTRASFQAFLQSHGLSSHVRCVARRPA